MISETITAFAVFSRQQEMRDVVVKKSGRT
jgi:hypothetical protein